MKKLLCHICLELVALACVSVNGYAIDFETGKYYFDNSKIHYSNIKFATFDTIAVSVQVYDLLASINTR